MLGLGLVSLGIAVYLGRSVARGELQLQQAALPWKVDRSLLGSERQTLDSNIDRVVVTAVDALHDPCLGLGRLRPTQGGARALKPAVRKGPLGVLLVRSRVSVHLTVLAHGAGGRFKRSATPAMVWTAWETIRSSTNWVAAGQELDDNLAAGIAAKLGNPTLSPSPNSAG
jgi:hypothetical protein